MTQRAWTQQRPTQPGFYYAVPVEHASEDGEDARDAIRAMASGWLPDPRPMVLVADVGPDDLEEADLVPFFAGIGDYPFCDLAHDFATVWWYGPLALPPPVPGLGSVRPPGQMERERFRLPRGWPPEA